MKEERIVFILHPSSLIPHPCAFAPCQSGSGLPTRKTNKPTELASSQRDEGGGIRDEREIGGRSVSSLIPHPSSLSTPSRLSPGSDLCQLFSRSFSDLAEPPRPSRRRGRGISLARRADRA